MSSLIEVSMVESAGRPLSLLVTAAGEEIITD